MAAIVCVRCENRHVIETLDAPVFSVGRVGIWSQEFGAASDVEIDSCDLVSSNVARAAQVVGRPALALRSESQLRRTNRGAGHALLSGEHSARAVGINFAVLHADFLEEADAADLLMRLDSTAAGGRM